MPNKKEPGPFIPFGPCPYCGGTIDAPSHVGKKVQLRWFCHSCGRMWDMAGRLITKLSEKKKYERGI